MIDILDMLHILHINILDILHIDILAELRISLRQRVDRRMLVQVHAALFPDVRLLAVSEQSIRSASLTVAVTHPGTNLHNCCLTSKYIQLVSRVYFIIQKNVQTIRNSCQNAKFFVICFRLLLMIF